MKNKFLSLLLALTMIFTLFTAVNVAAEETADSDPYTLELLNSTFETYVSPKDGDYVAPANWKLSASWAYSHYVEGRGTVLRLHSNAAQAGKLVYINYTVFENKITTFPGESLETLKRMKYDFEFSIEEKNSISLMLIHPNATKVGDRFTFGSMYGGDSATDAAATLTIMGSVRANLVADAWHRMQVYVDGYDETITVVLDGVELGTYACSSINEYTTGMVFSTAKNDQNLYIDNMKVSVIPALKIVNSYPIDGAEEVPRSGGLFEFETDRDILEMDTIEPVLLNADGEDTEAWVFHRVEGRKITVGISDTLEPGTTYTLQLLGKQFTFTTAAEDVLAPIPEITTVSGGCLAEATVGYAGEGSKEVTMVVASYYASDNKMFDYQIDTQLVSGTTPFEKTVSVPDEEYYVKAFFVDNLTNLNMFREDYSGDENFTFSGKGKADFVINSILPEGNNVIVKGTASDVGQRTVIVKAVKQAAPAEESEDAELMAASEPVIDFIAPVTTNEDGTFELSYSPSNGDGWYDYEINGTKISEPVETSAFYISLTTQTIIRDCVNNSATVDEVGDIIGTDYKTEINLEDKYYNENAYKTVFEQKPYADYTEIPAMIIKAYDLLEELNGTIWNSLSNYITTNESILLLDAGDYDYYSKLSGTNKNKINKVITGSYNSFDEFRKSFSNAVADYKAKLRSQAIGQQISSGTSGGTQSSTVQVSGGGASVTRPAVQPEPPKSEEPENTENTNAPKFSDLGGVEWAKESIEFLAGKNVISGDGNGNFRPLDSVSREEFVKMLVSVFGIEASDKTSVFSDVSEDAWYAPFLAAAKEAGIVNGKEDGSFGVGEKITRQDMAVMLQRAIEKSGKTLEGGEGEQFADADLFADYAKDAIAKLQSSGIVSGVGEGKFAPSATANRAQAAQMIYNLFAKEVVK